MVPAVAAVVFTGCAFEDEEQLAARGTKILQSKREASVGEWKDHKIHGVGALGYANNRTFLLIGGKTSLNVLNESGDATDANFDFSLRSDNPFDISSATAISADGYFLTAAHCVETSPLAIIIIDGRGKMVKSTARVVWRGRKENPDIALIHAPVRPYGYFSLAGWSDLTAGKPILTSGFGGAKQSKTGGSITRINARKSSRWIAFNHNAPLIQGDSGGGVIDPNGRLLGINSTVGFQFTSVVGRSFLESYECTAISPDPDWIRLLIAKDRAGR